MHQHGTVRISLQARPWAVGTSTRAVARAFAGDRQTRYPLNTVGQHPANLASIHPQFLKVRITQPPCSDQRTNTCSRNLVKHKRSPLKRGKQNKAEELLSEHLRGYQLTEIAEEASFKILRCQSREVPRKIIAKGLQYPKIAQQSHNISRSVRRHMIQDKENNNR